MSRPARTRESASMAAIAAAPPAECPAIAIRDGSISPAPGQGGCGPVSSSSTKETSAAPAAGPLSQHPGAAAGCLSGQAGGDPPAGEGGAEALVRVINPGHDVAVAGQVLGQAGERATGIGEAR